MNYDEMYNNLVNTMDNVDAAEDDAKPKRSYQMNYEGLYNNLMDNLHGADTPDDDAKPIEQKETGNSIVVCRFKVYRKRNVTKFYGYLNRLIKIRSMNECYMGGLSVPKDSNLGYFTLSDVFLMLDPKRLYTTDPRILCWYWTNTKDNIRRTKLKDGNTLIEFLVPENKYVEYNAIYPYKTPESDNEFNKQILNKNIQESKELEYMRQLEHMKEDDEQV